jgi:hypothetical protein
MVSPWFRVYGFFISRIRSLKWANCITAHFPYHNSTSIPYVNSHPSITPSFSDHISIISSMPAFDNIVETQFLKSYRAFCERESVLIWIRCTKCSPLIVKRLEIQRRSFRKGDRSHLASRHADSWERGSSVKYKAFVYIRINWLQFSVWEIADARFGHAVLDVIRLTGSIVLYSLPA